MNKLFIWIVFTAGLLIGGICVFVREEQSLKVIYKCPPGQVSIKEDAGTETESVRCYTPGVRYTDYRPDTTQKIDHWKEKEK